MITPIDLNEFEETRHIDHPMCEDELAQLRAANESLSDKIDSLNDEITMLVKERTLYKSQAIQAKAQAVTVAAERDRLGEENERFRRCILQPSEKATREQQIDDEILARGLIAQIEMVAEAEINADNWYQLFKQANAAKRELRKMYHKSIKQSDDLYRGYSMSLDDIGKIGEALGLNPSSYMTHSPLQVAEMVLKKAQSVTIEAECDELALWQRRAEAQLKITEAAINLTLTAPYEIQAANGAYWVSQEEYKNLRRACAEFKQLAESEAGQALTA